MEGHGILAFVLVSDEHTANRLLEVNGWGRMAPLEGICNDVSEVEGGKIPNWTPRQWKRAQLAALARSHFNNADVSALEIEDGENPLDLLRRARKLLRR